MKVILHKKVFETYDSLMVGLLHCTGINNTGNPVDIDEMLRDMEELIRLNFNPSTVQSNQLISAWKAAVAHFGEKAQHYESNVEKLMNSILSGTNIETKNKLVDLCNFVSLKHIIPLGVHDTSKLVNKLEFTLAESRDMFAPEGKAEAIEPGELIIRDDQDILARKLDVRTSKKAAVDKKTKDALVHIEALLPITEDKLKSVMEELSALIRIFCNGKIKKTALSKDKPEIEL